jgi:hypothetical protein
VLVCLAFVLAAGAAPALARPPSPALKHVRFSFSAGHHGSKYDVFVTARCTTRTAYGDWTGTWGRGHYVYVVTGGTACRRGALHHVFVASDARCGRMTLAVKTYNPTHLQAHTKQTFHVRIPRRRCRV